MKNKYIYTFNVVILIYYIYVYIFIYVISIPYITKPFRLQSQYGISRNVAFTFVDLNKNHALLSIPLTQQICFFHEPPRQVDNFCRHFCWLGNFLKEMTLNIVKGFFATSHQLLQTMVRVPLANFLIYVFFDFVFVFFSKCILWVIVRPQVKTPHGAHIIQYNSVCVLTVKLQWPLAKIGFHHISINLHTHKFI